MANRSLIWQIVKTAGPALVVMSCAFAACSHLGYWSVIGAAFLVGLLSAVIDRFLRKSTVRSRRETQELAQRFAAQTFGWRGDPRIAFWVFQPALTVALVVTIWAIPDAGGKPFLWALSAGLAFLGPKVAAIQFQWDRSNNEPGRN